MNVYHYMFTYGGPQLFVLFVLFVVTPIVLRAFLRNRPWRVRLKYLAALWMVSILIAYGDVFVIAVEAKRLCSKEAGMRIFSTAETDGIAGLLGIQDVYKFGFDYVERPAPGSKKIFLRERLINGKIVSEQVTELISKYELFSERTALTLPIVKEREAIRERETGRVLGEIIAFKFYPGWLDARLLGLLGFSWSPPRCDDDYSPGLGKRIHYSSDVITKVLRSS